MDRVSRLLPRTLHRHGLTEQARAALVVTRARQWLDERAPQWSAALEPRFLKDSILTLAASHSIALQEGQALVPDLLRSLQGELPEGCLTAVRLVRR